MLRPSLGAAWRAWKVWPPVGFGAEPLAVAAHQASEPRRPHGAHACLHCSGQAGPYRLAHRSMKSGLTLKFTASWAAPAAPALPKRQLALGLLRSTLQVREDLRNELRLLDAGDDLQLPAAARAALELHTEHSLQPGSSCCNPVCTDGTAARVTKNPWTEGR